MTYAAIPLPGIPEVTAGDDLASLILTAARDLEPSLRDGDILAVAHKIISKAEGRIRALAAITPGVRATAIAKATGGDPRLAQTVLDESATLLRDEPVLIAETRTGLVCANAGVDRSNVPGDDSVLLLPTDPDRSARELRDSIRRESGVCVAIVVTDSFGRAWRIGQAEVAIGCAGVAPVADRRGTLDREGRTLTATQTAVADQIAAAADLARDKSSGEPVILLRGLDIYTMSDDGPGATAMVRPVAEDLFR